MCNINCVFCPRKAVEKNRGLGMMSMEDFTHLVDKYHDLMPYVNLFHHGEATLHPDLVEMVKYASDYGCRVGLTTNGILMTPDLFLQLVDSGLKDLGFSFEGMDKETYESLRVGSDYDIVLRNIQECVRVNNKLNNPVRMNINVLDLPETHDKIPPFISKTDFIPMKVTPAHNWAGALNETFKLPPYNPVCPAPWFGLVIHYDGGIAPCCVETHFKRRFNVLKGDDIHDFWNGHYYQRFRKAMLLGRFNTPDCYKCKVDPYSTPEYRLHKNRWFPLSWKFIKLAMRRLL